MAARAAAAVGDTVAAARAPAAMGGAADAAQGGVGEATLGTSAAVDVVGVAWGATKNAVCGGVGQLSDPLEGQSCNIANLTLPPVRAGDSSHSHTVPSASMRAAATALSQ